MEYWKKLGYTQIPDFAKQELKEARVEGTAGGGVVRIAFDGELAPGTVEITEAWAAGRETVEELLTAALQDGFAKAARLRDGRLKDVTGGLDLPGLS